MNNRKAQLGTIGVMALGLGVAAQAFAFVPAAEQDIQAVYPVLIRPDLGSCTATAKVPELNKEADAVAFAKMLHGSWKLRSDTIAGLKKKDQGESMVSLYFDFEGALAGQSKGMALLVDQKQAQKGGDEAMAFWSIDLEKADRHMVSMSTAGELIGKYTRGPQKDGASKFFEYKDAFVALERDAKGAVSGKIVLTKNSLTYVSCVDQRVERYVPTSRSKPMLDGKTLSMYFQNQRASAQN